MYLPTRSDGKKWMKKVKTLIDSNVFKEYEKAKDNFVKSKEYKSCMKAQKDACCKVYKTLLEGWGDEGMIEEAEQSPIYFDWVLRTYETKINNLDEDDED